MQDLNDKITGGTLTATEWNEVPSEIQNVIESLGQTLSSGDLDQLGKGIAGYIANANFYTDTGIADAYVLTKIGSKQAATAYTDGFFATFLAGNANTGASAVNIAGLGIKNIIGSEVAGSIQAGEYITIRYRVSSGDFTLTPINSRSVSFLQSGTGAIPRDAWSKMGEVVSVADFGGGLGVEDGAAFNLALASLPATGGVVIAPATAYVIAVETRIKNNNSFIYFEQGSVVDIDPAAELIAFRIENDDTFTSGPNIGKIQPIVNTGILGNVVFTSADETYKKTLIKAIDVSGCELGNIRSQSSGSGNGHIFGAGSIGLDLYGREFLYAPGLAISVEHVFKLNKIPSDHVTGSVDCDHFHFYNSYLLTATANPIGEAETGMLLTSFTMDGFQSWIGSGDGFKWIDTTSVAVSNGLKFDNVRTEQGASGFWAINIEHNSGVQNVSFNGVLVGDRDGYNLKKCEGVTWNNSWFTFPAGQALTADGTCKELRADNCFWQALTTATLTGQTLVSATPLLSSNDPLSPSFHYTTSAGRAYEGFENSETASRAGFTEVLNGGSITSTICWTQIGNRVMGEVIIVCAGGATIQSVADTSSLTSTNLPAASTLSGCSCSSNAAIGYGNGYVSTDDIFPSSFVSIANATVIVAFNFPIA